MLRISGKQIGSNGRAFQSYISQPTKVRTAYIPPLAVRGENEGAIVSANQDSYLTHQVLLWNFQLVGSADASLFSMFGRTSKVSCALCRHAVDYPVGSCCTFAIPTQQAIVR
jgi:hypothetical protein